MRCNQVSILVERFGKYVPDNYPGDVQRISVYVDDFNSVYAALSKAYALTINELSEYEKIGVRADVSTNEFSRSDYREMHGNIPKEKRSYQTDINLQYGDSLYELCKDYIWMYEHSNEIIELIKTSKDKNEMTIKLKDKYNLSDYQIRKISQIRLDMLNLEGYEDCKAKIDEIEEWRKSKNTENIHKYQEESYKKYLEQKKRKIKLRIEELDAYFKVAENYGELFRLMEDYEEFHQFARVVNEKFGLTNSQVNYYKHLSIDEFSHKKRIEKTEELKRLREDLSSCEENLLKYES